MDATAPRKSRCDDGNIVEQSYHGCDAGSAAVLVTVNNLTHKWSGDRHGLGMIIDRGDLIATNVMWDILKHHPKP